MWNASNIGRGLRASAAAITVVAAVLGLMCLAAELAYMLTGGLIETLGAAVGVALCATILLLSVGEQDDATPLKSTETENSRRDPEWLRYSQMEPKPARGESAMKYLDTAPLPERERHADRAEFAGSAAGAD